MDSNKEMQINLTKSQKTASDKSCSVDLPRDLSYITLIPSVI